MLLDMFRVMFKLMQTKKFWVQYLEFMCLIFAMLMLTALSIPIFLWCVIQVVRVIHGQ